MAGCDAIIVGARCAGAALGAQLARGGMDVLMIDRDTFPSDTLSTHALWPNSVAALERIGALERLNERHDVPALLHRFRILGIEVAGGFSAVDGFDYCIAPRRVALDAVLVDTARAAGVECRFGEKVAGLIGAGTEGDPVRGVSLASGEGIEAKWVFACDGRASTVSGKLGLEKREPLRGEMSFLLAYWTGLPETEYLHLDVATDAAMSWFPCEDGIHLLVMTGPPGFTRGSARERERRYLHGLSQFPTTLDVSALESAERVSEIRVAPETMLRGYYRDACGPGWALVGDAGHFKHPVTAQGISDALEQATFIADALIGGDDLAGFEDWRQRRGEDHYAWSYQFAQWPREEVAGPLFAGMAADEEAGQDFRDSFSRLVPTREVMSKERLSRWFAEASATA